MKDFDAELVAKCAALMKWDNRILPHYYSGDHLTADGTLALIKELLEAGWAMWLSKDDDKSWFVWKNDGERWHDEVTVSESNFERATMLAYLKMKGVER